jgi:hypothetical protein
LIEQFNGEDVEVSASWLRTIAEALEAVTAERDDALAVIEKVRAIYKRARPSTVSGNLIADGNALGNVITWESK